MIILMRRSDDGCIQAIKTEAGKTIAPNVAPADFLRKFRLPICFFIFPPTELDILETIFTCTGINLYSEFDPFEIIHFFIKFVRRRIQGNHVKFISG